MLTDQQLADALQEKASIVLAKVLSSTLLIPGTRSQRTEYEIEISQTLLGQGNGKVSATHFGTAQLGTGKTYLIVLVPTGRFGPTQEMEAWVEVPKQQQSEILKTHADRLHHLAPKTP